MPELETAAYILIAFIGAKMGLTLLNIHIPHSIFFTVMILSFVTTFTFHYVHKVKEEHTI
ncbi:hypothetical protein [Bacillus sp. JJ722]|uniref:hypothetical protein n=1 Tax=Bacillus sp. JJ722 TaxID=3122973 RepID=UPI002FFFD265